MRFDICNSFANKSAHNLLEELAFDWPYMSEKIQELQTVLSSNQRFHFQMQILQNIFAGNTNSTQAGKCQISWVFTAEVAIPESGWEGPIESETL